MPSFERLESGSLKGLLEALLLVTDDPVSAADLAAAASAERLSALITLPYSSPTVRMVSISATGVPAAGSVPPWPMNWEMALACASLRPLSRMASMSSWL